MKRNEKAIILIVDDKPANILALDGLLSNSDRIIMNANSGEEALKIALEQKIDLIILDVQMPNMDGFEVAQILKSNKKTKDVPIIFASAEKKEHASMMKGFGEGAVDYLFKPLDPEITRAKVSVLLKVQLQKKELIEKNALLEKSALLINNSADIIGIVDAATLRIEEVNPAFTAITGYNSEESRGTSVLFYLDNQDRVPVQKLMLSGKEKHSFETRFYCKNRRIKWLDWNVVVKHNKWFVNARDITEIKQVETIRNYLATVVKQSNDSIYIHDQDGKIISWNEGAKRIYGYSESEALQMKIWNIIPEFLTAGAQEMVTVILKGEKIDLLETKRVTKHGKLMDVLFSAALISEPGTPNPSIVITERDVTQLKIADEKIRQLNATLQKNVLQLEAANRELESFSYSVSHDLRAPLRAMYGNAQVLEEDYGDKLGEEAKMVIGKLHSNVNRMDRLINDLLSFSRIGKKELRKSDVDIAELVRNVLAEIGNGEPIKAQVEIGDLPEAYGDASLLNQVWTNLISNAIKYSSKKENPFIEVAARQRDGEVEYYVKDNGAGFDMNYAGKLFGTFQRLHDVAEFEGTGIGLAIVQRIILKHGGTIRAEAAPEKGATFYFTLAQRGESEGV
ncbi:MAG: PAS domain S-box protein [Cyclobacteriaceae bacterium]